MDSNITEEKIKEVAQKVADHFNPEKIILFGSWAEGNPTADSDVDLFVVKDTEESSRDMAREIDRYIFPRPFPLDILVYKPEEVDSSIENGNFFIRNIVTKGKVLYEK